jgi:hypothetical protein
MVPVHAAHVSKKSKQQLQGGWIPSKQLPTQLSRTINLYGTEVDVTFRVGGRAFNAHKTILAARSPVSSK